MNYIILVILAWVISEAYRDGTDMLEGKYISNHTSRFINRCTVGTLSALLNPIYGLITLLIFWVVFDAALNLFRGLKWNYIGSVANTDKFAHKYPTVYWGSKVISIIGIIIMVWQTI
jgi:hypothetical protein